MDSEANTFLDGVATHVRPGAVAAGIVVGGTALLLGASGPYLIPILSLTGRATAIVVTAGLVVAGVVTAARKGKLDAYETR